MSRPRVAWPADLEERAPLRPVPLPTPAKPAPADDPWLEAAKALARALAASLPDPDPPLLLTVPEAAVQLRVSEAQVYRLMAADGLPWLRVGTVKRIPREGLEVWILDRTRP